MTNQEIANIVEHEGFGYAVMQYDGNCIDDPILSEKWKQASKLLWEIRRSLPEPEDEELDT